MLLLTRNTAHAVRLWQGFLLLLSLMAGYGLIQAYVCRARPGWLGAFLLDSMCAHPTRVSGPFSIYMTFGGVLLLGTLFFLAYLSNVPWREAWWMVPASVVSLVALGLTYSRNAWLGLGAGVTVNPSGGLKSKGHPIGATGVSMHVLSAMQLTGSAGDMQIEGAKLGGIFNMGGAAVANYVSILEPLR